ncbi:VOC family protein [Rhodoferax sp.]|uniref:VOC family protein n=1 Tax=Rhodoferax sp. TaxID=50421 RepID=UPI00271F08CF|nr:VOC family protein [Rhodoferax sp.]MDO9195394.1 VOC family protein [Rhodoferax sp.]
MSVSLFGKVRLGYVLVESNRLAEWKNFGANGLGLHVDVVDSGALAFRIDGHQRRLIVTPGPAEDVTEIGVQVDDEASLNEVIERLKVRGIVVHDGTPEEACLSGVERLVKFIGPKRLNFGLYTRPVLSEQPLKMLTSGFTTGAGGMGHAAFSSREPEAFQAFWQEVFDARLSDYIEDRPGGMVLDITFLRLNERHHSIAIAATRGRRMDPMRARIHHLNLQAANLDDISGAYRRCREMGYSIANAIGQHPNDRELSFYVVTPSEFEIEIGWSPIIVDEANWTPVTHRGISLWGHFKENDSVALKLKMMRRAITSLWRPEHVAGSSR